MERKEIPISKKFFIDVNGNIFDSNVSHVVIQLMLTLTLLSTS